MTLSRADIPPCARESRSLCNDEEEKTVLKEIIGKRKIWATRVVDFFYPPRCPLCGKIIGGQALACPECLKEAKPVKEPRCKKCGKSLGNDEQEFCRDCSKGTHLYMEGRGIFPYRGQMKQAVLDLKYRGKRENARFLGTALARLGEAEVRRWQPEVLIPVPLHKKRRKIRGYNQAELLAKVCGQLWKIPVDTKLVERKNSTKAQKQLNPEERRKNLQGAFCISPTGINYRSVLIIDDIYTTGSTVDAVTAALKKSGVEHIYFLTVCIGTDS